MPKETMTSRERWLCVLEGKKPDRVPMDYWGTPEANRKLMQRLGCDDLATVYKKLHIDNVVPVAPPYIGPAMPPISDIYGCKYEPMYHDQGVYIECTGHPLAQYSSVEEIEANYTWPSPDWFDYSAIPAQIKGKEDRPLQAGGSEPFLAYKNLRGMDQAYMDLILNPEIVAYCLDKMFDLHYETSSRIYEEIPGKTMLAFVAEDFGGQLGLIVSPDIIRNVFLPRMKRMIDLGHQAGAYVFHHDDGAIRKIIPDLIEIGVDILNPIQWRCEGMDRKELKRDFGDKLVFHGGVDNQHTLAFGSTEEVREEVVYNLEVLGKGGGYILAPCHAIQSISPVENIIALYEAGYEHGWR
jgi:uroporphyrinogen decarboxylase